MAQQSPNVRLSADTKTGINSLVEKIGNRTGYKETQDRVVSAAIRYAGAHFEDFGSEMKMFGYKAKAGDLVTISMLAGQPFAGSNGALVETFTFGGVEMGKVNILDESTGDDHTGLTFPLSYLELTEPEFAGQIGDLVTYKIDDESGIATIKDVLDDFEVLLTKQDGTEITVGQDDVTVTATYIETATIPGDDDESDK